MERWHGCVENGLLAADADLETLTTTMLAAIQGGLLLAKTSRDSTQLRAALEGAIAQLRAHGVRRQASPVVAVRRASARSWRFDSGRFLTV